MKIFIYLIVLCSLAFSSANGQSSGNDVRSPIPIEVMFGNEEVNYLTILDLPIDQPSGFGYFGVISALIPYENERSSNEIVISNSLTYNFSGKFDALSGLQLHYAKGAVPYLGVQYFSANPTWLILFSPNLQLAPTTNFEGVGIVEYKPAISNDLRLYSRLQAIYNQNFTAGTHERSFIYTRLGISWKKVRFGTGFNLDFYGSDKTREIGYGLFINHLF